jgi:uncharacterized protein YgiM (DUF1202 family)
MTQYDAGPGDWSDREWEEPDRKRKPHATRRRLVLPPWALLAILVGVVIVLCVALVLFVRALRERSDEETLVPAATATLEPTATSTSSVQGILTTIVQTPLLPSESPDVGTQEPPTYTEIAPGASVVVQGTRGAGLNIREEPSRQGRIVTSAKEGDELTVLEGPEEAGGYVWWKVRTKDGEEGWGASEWLVLKTD